MILRYAPHAMDDTIFTPDIDIRELKASMASEIAEIRPCSTVAM